MPSGTYPTKDVLMKFDKAIQLTDKDSGVSIAIARLNNTLIDKSKTDKSKFFRRQAVKITNRENGYWTLRYCMGSAGLKGLSKNAIAIDYDAADSLGIRFNQPVDLLVEKASYFRALSWYMRHPDQSVRMNTHLAVLGAALGAVGLVLSII